MSNASFDRITTVTASTKRRPAAVSGVVGVPVTKLSGIAIEPLMPIRDAAIVEMYKIKSPRQAFETFTASGQDIEEGDILTVNSTDYTIKAVPQWGDTLNLMLEKVEGN